MEFINHTQMIAVLQQGAVTDVHNGVWVVARQSYAINTDGTLGESEQWPILDAPLATRFGVLPSDNQPFWKGTDVIVLGTVVNEEPRRQTDVSLSVGDQQRHLRVFGERHWHQISSGDFVPTDPQPFASLPLTWEHAFGGQVRQGKCVLRHGLNPSGMGFVVDPGHVQGSHLPRIESPSSLFVDWRVPPLPAGWAPLLEASAWDMAERCKQRPLKVTDEPEALIAALEALTPSAATPSNRFPVVLAGTPVVLIMGDRRLSFVTPPLRPALTVSLDNTVMTRLLAVSSIWIASDERRVIFTWKARLAYPVEAGQRRLAELMETKGGEGGIR